MDAETPPVITSDERLLAAVAHLFGLLVALIVWATQKEKSLFVRFQSVQAIAFNGIVMLASMALSGCLGVLMVLAMLVGVTFIETQAAPGEMDWLFLIQPLSIFLIFILWMPFSLLLLVIRVVAAWSVFRGKDFRYPVLGRQVEKFLQD
jgi:uncharacterized Tic20 family protein